ncbi:unnamed protein product [Dracunculus medinensis]|uniref:Bromo domain-containing protein n=1 Tax=Dracunculus medinensis TaxID=318479 RepID=A0A0N4U9I7_DRAME|nr:unnamed protein product [Dracunculus medinensis]
MPSKDSISRLCLGGEIVKVPSLIVQMESFFRLAVSKKMHDLLSVEAQKYLTRFLPSEKYKGHDNSSIKDMIIALDDIFTDDKNFFFGNPLEIVYSKIRCGWFNPERPADKVQLRDNCMVRYDHFIREYHINLVKKLHIARQRLLNHISYGYEICLPPHRDKLSLKRKIARRKLKERIDCRYKMMIDDINKKADVEEISSDDEDLSCNQRLPLKKVGRSTLSSPDFPDLDLHHPIYMDNVKDMLKSYAKFKRNFPKSPALDFHDITIEGVYERSGVSCIAEKNLPAEITEAMKQQIDPPRYSSKSWNLAAALRNCNNN